MLVQMSKEVKLLLQRPNNFMVVLLFYSHLSNLVTLMFLAGVSRWNLEADVSIGSF